MKTDDDNLTVSAFKEIVDSYQNEICCNGKKSGSHSYPSSVYFNLKYNDDYHSLKLVGHEPHLHGGCNCWTGITFDFEAEQDIITEELAKKDVEIERLRNGIKGWLRRMDYYSDKQYGIGEMKKLLQ